LGVDALIQGRRDIYVRGGQASLDIDLSPVVSSHVKGVSMSLRF
jgi:prolyl-tRNA editing enzyme YbaK/EbsC (Cys-tRNA(Pro) deacylase)